MKKLILLFAVLLAANSTFAQDEAKKGKGKGKLPVEQRAQRSVDKLDKAVTLTAEQKTKVYDLSLTRATKHDEIKAKYKGQPEKKEEAKAEFKANHKEYRTSVKAILTPEQIATLKAKHKAKKGAKKTGAKPTKIQNEQEPEVEEMIPVED